LKPLLEFINKDKETRKRSAFDIDFLEEWLAYLDSHGFLHTHLKNGEIKGVITMFPIGKHKKTPTIDRVVECMQLYAGGETDYFIMDAVVDNEESRKILVKRLLNIYPDIEYNHNCQIYAQRGDKITKFNKRILLTLTK